MKRLTQKRLELLQDLTGQDNPRITNIKGTWDFEYHFACDYGYARAAETDVKALVELGYIHESYRGDGVTVWTITDAGRTVAGGNPSELL